VVMERKEVSVSHIGDLADANFPRDHEGRVYHLGVKRGEVANRIVSVGEGRRAALLATHFDDSPKPFVLKSHRDFVIHTGKINGVPLTVIATGMGTPMVDFVLRETRAVVDGPMAVVRFGTCGTPQSSIPIGSVIVASKGAVFVERDYDAIVADPLIQAKINGSTEKEETEKTRKSLDYYHVTKLIPGDALLSKQISESLEEHNIEAIQGEGASTDSFYSSQGRTNNYFDDFNDTLVDELLTVHPQLSCFEMETYHLYHMALCSKGSMVASAATIVLAQRRSGEFLSQERKHELERVGGLAVMQGLAKFPLDEKSLMSGDDCVWNK